MHDTGKREDVNLQAQSLWLPHWPLTGEGLQGDRALVTVAAAVKLNTNTIALVNTTESSLSIFTLLHRRLQPWLHSE